jgi:hypothetical protein
LSEQLKRSLFVSFEISKSQIWGKHINTNKTRESNFRLPKNVGFLSLKKIVSFFFFSEDPLFNLLQNREFKDWRRGAVDIASDSGTRRLGLKSSQVIRFYGNIHSRVVLLCAKRLNMHCLCDERRNKGIGHKIIF